MTPARGTRALECYELAQDLADARARLAAWEPVVRAAAEYVRLFDERAAALEKAHRDGGDRVAAFRGYRDDYFAADDRLRAQVHALPDEMRP